MGRDILSTVRSKQSRLEDLTGKVFDRLTVIKHVGTRLYGKRTTGTALWECLCICGTVKNITASALKNKKARSCGCYLTKYRSLNMRNKFDETHAAKTQVFLSYRGGAKRRNINFELSKEQVIALSQKNCYYCNAEPENTKKLKHRDGYKYNGIDRINNDLGYTKDNSVSCCEICNRAKRILSKDDFLNWIKRVYQWNLNFYQNGN